MQYRKLGTTDIEVSAVAFGAWAIVGGFNWGPQDEEDSLAALRAAYDAGVTFFDTAEAYGDGRSEEMIRRALGDVRDRIVIASKALPNHFAPDDLRQACERSLRALATDRIDLYQLHWPNPDIPLEDTVLTLDALKKEGKIRACGVSNFGPEYLGRGLASPVDICSNQVAYNLLFRAIEYEIRPVCEREQISILCYCPLMQGLLSGRFAQAEDVPEDRARTRHFSSSRPQTRHGSAGEEDLTFETIARLRGIAAEAGESLADLSIAWLLAQPGVASAIVGARNADQARRNVRGADLALAPDLIRRLTGATDDLKECLGRNADLWQCDSRTL